MTRKRRETKRFDFFAWLENYQYLDQLANHRRTEMAKVLNEIISDHRERLEKAEPVSKRHQ
jgi:hypothetical protein